MLCLGHKVEQLFNQLHMKRGAEEREEIGVEYHIISFYPHTTQQDGNIIPIDNSLMPRRARRLTRVWLAPLGFALQNEIIRMLEIFLNLQVLALVLCELFVYREYP